MDHPAFAEFAARQQQEQAALEQEAPINPLLLTVFRVVGKIFDYGQTGLKYGWLPLVAVLGATTVYCEPGYDIRHMKWIEPTPVNPYQ